MDYHSLVLFTLTEAALSLSPGPAVLLVIATGMASGWRASLIASIGILSGNACYFMLSALGLGGLLQQAPFIFIVIKYLGAAYLLYLAWLALTGRPSVLRLNPADKTTKSKWHLYLQAVLLQLLNPKTLLMFVAILPQFIQVQHAIVPQMLALAACSMIPEFFILAAYGILASKASKFASSPRFTLLVERTSGFFILLAAAMVLMN